MSDKPYEKTCLYCQNKIIMSKETGKWLPYNLNNGPHECRKNETNSKPKQETFDHNNVLELEDILKRLKTAYGDLENYLKESKK